MRRAQRCAQRCAHTNVLKGIGFKTENGNDHRSHSARICRRNGSPELAAHVFRQSLVADSGGIRGRKYVSSGLYRLLSPGEDSQEAGGHAWRGVRLIDAKVAVVNLLRHRSYLAIALVMVSILGGCGRGTPTPSHQAVGQALESVVVKSTQTAVERKLDGVIEAVNQGTVAAQTSGR